MTDQPDTIPPHTMPPSLPIAKSVISTSATFITLILALFSSLAALYAITLTRDMERTFASIQASITADRTKSHELEVTIATLNEAHAGLQTELSNLVHQIKITSVTQDQLLLSVEQARDYLELAHIEAKWESNESTCLILINKTKKILQTLKDPSLQPILDALNQAEQEIASRPKLELTTMINQFHNIEEKLSSFSLQLPASQPAQPITPSTTPESTFNKTVNTFKNLIIIQHHPVTNLTHLSLQEAMLVNRILMNLQVAKLAVLQQKPDLYKLALEEASQDIRVAFDKQSDLKQSFLNAITQLSEMPINTPLPDLKAPLHLLKQWLEAHHADKAPTPVSPS